MPLTGNTVYMLCVFHSVVFPIVIFHMYCTAQVLKAQNDREFTVIHYGEL